jgi:hypothetical protein
MYKMLMCSVVAAIAVLCTEVLAAESDDPPAGSDWTTYSYPSQATLWYRRDGSNVKALRKAVTIDRTNGNFDSSHCITSAADKVTHIHYELDYDQDFGDPYDTVTADEGEAFFDWCYDGYTPTPAGGGSPTGETNCRSYAYHGYKGASTKANYWVNDGSGAGALYRGELTEVSPRTTDNSDFDTEAGDRCDHPNHVWVVDEDAGVCKAAKKIIWKNNSSGVYTWTHADGDETNDAPKGKNTDGSGSTSLYDDGYGVYRK